MTDDINKLCLKCMRYGLDEAGVCRLCGWDGRKSITLPHHLMERTVLNGKYLSAKVLGEGGFGITYLGWDINLEIKVAIKEYYPLGAVTRNTTMDDRVTAIPGNTEQLFSQGRERFIDEARRLAKFYNLPGIVSVKDFFLENGTAYIVMEFVEGVTLKEYLDEIGGRMDETTVLELMKPLIKSLSEVHRAGVIHRDISPDNIMLTPDGQLRLIDFGAARDFNDENKSLSVLLKPGYAPEEQYRSRGKQGPWTDIYALSATIFRAIEGDKPPESMERMYEDKFRGFSVPVSRATNDALMKGLAVRADDRWQSVYDLYKALYGVSAEAAPTTVPSVSASPAATPPVAAAPAAAARPKPKSTPPAPVQAAVSSGNAGVPPSAAPVPAEKQWVAAANIGVKPAESPGTAQRKKRNILIAVVSAVLVVALALVLTLSPKSQLPVAPEDKQEELTPPAPVIDTSPIKIGAIITIDPSTKAEEKYSIQGMLYAIEEINASGGIGGRMIELVVEVVDDSLSGRESAGEALRLLVAERGVTMALTDLRGEGALEDAAKELGVPVISARQYGSDAGAISGGIFSLNISSSDQARMLAAISSEIMGAQNATCVYTDEYDMYIKFNDVYSEYARGLGINATSAVLTSNVAEDRRKFAADLLRNYPNTDLFCTYFDFTAKGLLEGARSASPNIRVVCTGDIYSLPELMDLGSDYENIYALTEYIDEGLAAALIAGYEDRWDKEVDENILAGYEGVHLFAQAMTAAGSDDSQAVLEVFRNGTFSSINGTPLYFRDDGRVCRQVFLAFNEGGTASYLTVDSNLEIASYTVGS